jgi:ABC-type oligopeptide transport system ATPase subunit
VEYAPTEEIFRNPKSEYTRNLIASVPAMPTVEQLEAREKAKLARGTGAWAKAPAR